MSTRIYRNQHVRAGGGEPLDIVIDQAGLGPVLTSAMHVASMRRRGSALDGRLHLRWIQATVCRQHADCVRVTSAYWRDDE